MKLAIALIALLTLGMWSNANADCSLSGEIINNPCMDGSAKPFTAWTSGLTAVDTTHGSCSFTSIPTGTAYDKVQVRQDFTYTGPTSQFLECQVTLYSQGGGTATVALQNATNLSFAGMWQNVTLPAGTTVQFPWSFQATQTGLLRLVVFMGATGGYATVDDFHLRSVQCTLMGGIVPNTDFECGSLGPWTPQTTDGNSIAVSNAHSLQGAYSLQFAIVSPGEDWQNQARVLSLATEPGATYAFSVLAQADRSGTSLDVEFGPYGNAETKVVDIPTNPTSLTPFSFVASGSTADLRLKCPSAGFITADLVRLDKVDTPVLPTTWGSIKARYR